MRNAGLAGWAKSVTHTVENRRDRAAELIEVELKGEHEDRSGRPTRGAQVVGDDQGRPHAS
jgi:hypothetical protein